jgi:hypothetical protein
VSSDILEVGQPICTARDAVTIISDCQIGLAVLAATRDDNGLGMCVDAVLDKLRNGFQRIRL